MGTITMYDAYEMVVEDVLNAIKYTEERNSNFNSEFLENVVDFLENRKDIVNGINERERYYNCFRCLEHN